jgi:uncharacterized protein (TIGR03067 family)
MFRLSVMTTVALLFGGFCIGDDKKDEKKDDKDLLQGEWVVVSTELNGVEVGRGKERKLAVKGDEWTAPSNNGVFKFKIDATKNPKQLDLIRTSPTGTENTWHGIFKIEGDTLTFCRSHGAGGERPKEFKAAEGNFLMICTRAAK